MYLCTGNIHYSILLASKGVNTTCWNHRLQHMSEKGMQILQKRNFLLAIKQIDLDLYENCVYGNHGSIIFLRVKKETKSERLDLVHTYVWGPTQVIFNEKVMYKD